MDGEVRKGKLHVKDGPAMSVLLRRLGFNPYLRVRYRREHEDFITVYPKGMVVSPHLRLLAEFLYTYYDNKLAITDQKRARVGLRVYY